MKLSIIIPFYNSSLTIQDTIKSIQSPILRFIDEIIIYNDGSTDNYKEIIKVIKKSDSRVKFYSSSINRGGAFARNYAIKKSKNELLMIIDADNIIDPKSLLKLYNYAKKNKLGAHYAVEKYFKVNKKIIDGVLNYSKHYKHKIKYKSFLNNFVCMDNFMFTKRQWKIAGKYNTSTHWDTQDFSTNYLKKVGDVKIIKNTFYYHRRFFEQSKSYYERQEMLGENFFNSFKLFEIFFEDIKLKNLTFLLTKDVFLSENIITCLEKYRFDNYIKLPNQENTLKLILKSIKCNKENKFKTTKKLIKDYLSNTNYKITDLILFLLVISDKKYNNKNYNEFKKIKNYFNFLIIFIKYPQSINLISVYSKFIILTVLRQIKKFFFS